MKQHSLISLAKRSHLYTGKVTLIFAAIISAALLAQAQALVDLRIYTSIAAPVVILGSGQDAHFQIYVKKGSKPDATGVVVTAPLPADTVFSSVKTDLGTCSYADNLITCDLGNLSGTSIDYDAVIDIYLRPTAAGTITLTSQVMGRETDPDLSNNIVTATATVSPPKSRKRVRFF